MLGLLSDFHRDCKGSFPGMARFGSVALNGCAKADIRLVQKHELIIAASRDVVLMNEAIINA